MLLRESYREGGKVRTRTLANLSDWPDAKVEALRRVLKGAIAGLGITYPVAVDNDYTIWRAFENEYWPAHYFIDAQGRVRYQHFGEGDYDHSEHGIQQLLAEAAHHRQHDDQRRHAQRHADQGEDGDEGNEALALTGREITPGKPALDGGRAFTHGAGPPPDRGVTPWPPDRARRAARTPAP